MNARFFAFLVALFVAVGLVGGGLLVQSGDAKERPKVAIENGPGLCC
ncbi:MULTISPECIES: hypothetical protein [unclassified Streptomyces]|jgi:hypothetical protein